MISGQDEHLFYVWDILGVQCSISNTEVLLKGTAHEMAAAQRWAEGRCLQAASRADPCSPIPHSPGCFSEANFWINPWGHVGWKEPKPLAGNSVLVLGEKIVYDLKISSNIFPYPLSCCLNWSGNRARLLWKPRREISNKKSKQGWGYLIFFPILWIVGNTNLLSISYFFSLNSMWFCGCPGLTLLSLIHSICCSLGLKK